MGGSAVFIAQGNKKIAGLENKHLANFASFSLRSPRLNVVISRNRIKARLFTILL
jgi:hypothetical protein